MSRTTLRDVSAADAGAPSVGVLQFVPQLEDAVWGFLGRLSRVIGQSPRVTLLQADGREQRCPALARELVDGGCDLLFGTLTPAAAALAAAAAATRTPVVFAPVFHPGLAGLVAAENRPGGHVTGVSGRLDPDLKIDRIGLLFPVLDSVTLLVDADDPLSRWEAEQLAAAFARRKIRAEQRLVENGEPTPSAPDTLHVLVFAPALEENMHRWIDRFHAAHAPLIGSSARAGFQGAVLSVFADHAELGETAAEMAAEILGGRDPATFPVRYPESARVAVSYHAAGRLGLRIPPHLGQTVDVC